MIKTVGFTKIFDDKVAVDQISLTFEGGRIYGLVGTNGSGKSTFLRGLCGVYTADSGRVLIDDADIAKTHIKRADIFLVSDDSYFFINSTLNDMASFYRSIYSGWSQDIYEGLVKSLPIVADKNIKSFSKGMKRQCAIILALACQPRFLLLDEAFDGLDPVVRVAIRRLIADKVFGEGMTVIIASHNLRELEDFCDTIILLHEGSLILNQEVSDISKDFCKVQLAFNSEIDMDIFKDERILSIKQSGVMITIVAKSSMEEMQEVIQPLSPILCEYLPLTLEEVFIYEMEAAGYDYNNIIF